MYQRILLPLDGSTDARQLVSLAGVIAAGARGTVILFRALEPVRQLLHSQGTELTIDEQMDIQREQALRALEPVKRQLAACSVPVEQAVAFGRPAAAILDFAERERVDLIAMATHGRAGLARMVYGSVTDAVLRHSRIPLLVTHAADAPLVRTPRLSRILVPLDGSGLAENALPHARELALAHGADVVLFAIWNSISYELPLTPRDEIEAQLQETHARAKHYLIEKSAALQAQGVRARWQLQAGLVPESIVAAAKQQGASLIVMSTHGRRGLNLWVEGSVADEVLRATDIPVLLIRDPQARDEFVAGYHSIMERQP